MSGNSGAWGVAMWKDGHSGIAPQLEGISLEGGDPVLPFLPTDPVGTLLVPPAGMGVPAVRSGDVAFAQRDGVVQFADYYEPRILTFQVLVKNDDCPGCSSSPAVDGALVLTGVAPGHALTPDAPALDITGDIEISAHVALDDWTPGAAQVITSKWGGPGARSYLLRIEPNSRPRLFWTSDGTTALNATATANPVVTDGEDLWVRATLDVDNGAAGRTIRFYTSSDGVAWTQLGADVVQAGVTSISASSSPVEVGSDTGGTASLLVGRVFYVEIRNGIGGPIVASPNFNQPARYSSFADAQGNVWTVTPPASLVAYQPARMSARQKVSRLTQEWSRNCSGATLVLFTDCHSPDPTPEEHIYNGPYLVRGRPRVADVAWERSNRGAARVTLRFDANDARLVLVSALGPDFIWDSENTQTLDADEQNLAPDPDLSGLTMTLNGATVNDTHPTTDGPLSGDGGPYFRRHVIAPNTTSPMTMALSGTGTAAIPINPADVLSVAWWARKDPGGGPTPRVDWTWYNAAGAVISSANGGVQTANATWSRKLQENIVAPALAEFVQFRLVWTGTALADQTLDFGQAWINRGATSTAPETMEVGGTLCVYPTITLFPNLTAPIVVTYGGHEFTYTEDVLVGTVVEIDTRYGRAADGFEDVTENLEGDYSSPLEPGVHEVTVQTGNPADTGFVNIQWENAVVAG